MRIADIPAHLVAAYAAVNRDRMIEIVKAFPNKAVEIYHATYDHRTCIADAVAIARAVPDQAIDLASALKGDFAAAIARVFPDKAFKIAMAEPDTAIPIVRALKDRALTLALAKELPDKAIAIARNHPEVFRP